jgi:hypothetical protein
MYPPPPGYGRRDLHDDPRRYGAVQPRPRRSRAGTFAALGTIMALALWAGVATLYILFRDDALKLIAGRHIEMVRAHDAQIVRFETEIERLKSLKLIEQGRVDRAVAELARRQSALEMRHMALSGFAAAKANAIGPPEPSPETTGSLPSPSPPTAPAAGAKPSPLSDTLLIAPPAERFARLESRPVAPLGGRLAESEARTPIEVRIANLGRGHERLEAADNAVLNRIEERYDRIESRMRNVFSDLGLRSQQGGGVRLAGMGGPFFPLLRPPEDPFLRQLERVRASAATVDELTRGLAVVPVRRPLPVEAELTSGFGQRVDPFVHQIAFHAGVDLRGEPGAPVRATAAGRVTLASINGGYGLMVEIDHGNGLSTRYAHLSTAAVSEGMKVAAGTVIGRVGTSGRSTGPHLHYEVRINGEAVDPRKYLRAGVRLSETRSAD